MVKQQGRDAYWQGDVIYNLVLFRNFILAYCDFLDEAYEMWINYVMNGNSQALWKSFSLATFWLN